MIVVKKSVVDFIPIVTVHNADNGVKRPVIIMLHGGGGKKEDNIERAKEFADKGFYVLLFDAYGHGELKVDIDGYEELLKVYTESSSFINKILKFGSKNLKFGDFKRVGLLGFSMGAHIIYYYITRERNNAVRAAVPIIGSPDWLEISKRYISENTDLENLLKKTHPLAWISSLADFPLAILNGAEDERISISTIRDFYHEVNKLYTDKTRVVFYEYEEVGHKVTNDMLIKADEWFKSYL